MKNIKNKIIKYKRYLNTFFSSSSAEHLFIIKDKIVLKENTVTEYTGIETIGNVIIMSATPR